MTDSLSREHRSWNMSRIRGSNTKPEMALRSLLHRNGLRFRLHARGLPGRPDIVFKKHQVVVFVHGCFWHRHSGCQYAYDPKSNRKFWLRKFKSNIDRDIFVKRGLRKLGWRVIVVWECQINRDAARVADRTAAIIARQRKQGRR